jgi:hypothetical protein
MLLALNIKNIFMKVIIQIPCKNEEENLPKVLSELPKEIK